MSVLRYFCIFIVAIAAGPTSAESSLKRNIQVRARVESWLQSQWTRAFQKIDEARDKDLKKLKVELESRSEYSKGKDLAETNIYTEYAVNFGPIFEKPWRSSNLKSNCDDSYHAVEFGETGSQNGDIQDLSELSLSAKFAMKLLDSVCKTPKTVKE